MAIVRTGDQVTLAVVYAEEYLLELECQVLVGSWSGVARAYTTPIELGTFAQALRGFPQTAQSVAELTVGADNGTGFIQMRLSPIDRAGHLTCYVRLATDEFGFGAQVWRMEVQMGTEAAAIDRFARQLARLAEEQSGKAVLVGC